MQNEQAGRGRPSRGCRGYVGSTSLQVGAGKKRKIPPTGVGGWIGWLGGGGSDRGLFLVLLGGVAVVVLSGFGGVAS